MSEHFRAGGRFVVACAFIVTFLAFATPADALTDEECASLVAEGIQARADLQKLVDRVAQDPSVGNTSNPDTASYVADLIAKTQINEFGFVGASAGAPLDICLPEGTTKVEMFSDPIVLWTGPPATANQPVSVQIPTGVTCGPHRLQATGEGVDKSVTFEVTGACTEVLGSTTSALPRTGAEIGRVVGIGVALIVVGFAISRRRRSAPAGALAD